MLLNFLTNYFEISSGGLILMLSVLSYAYFSFCIAYSEESTKYEISISRKVSRMTGRMMKLHIPYYLRSPIYTLFGKCNGVKFDEMKAQSLTQFRTFNQFFTRELKPGVRKVDTPEDIGNLVSPCDGRVLSHGTIDTENFTMECIKGNAYTVDEFWQGYNETANCGLTLTRDIVSAAKARGKKMLWMVIYLAPGDYHRYHSPADFTASYRRHLPGYLQPVDPRFLRKHRNVLKSNERVNLFGHWIHGFFGLSFVGATNVGSVKIHFDEGLKTNVRRPEVFSNDRNYAMLDPALSYLNFDDGKTSPMSSENSSDETDGENDGEGHQPDQRIFTLTSTGIHLSKGEEIGMFEMGSTIVLMFECPKNTKFTVKEGEKLFLGQKLTQN